MASPCNWNVFHPSVGMIAKLRHIQLAVEIANRTVGGVVKYNGRIVWRGDREHNFQNLAYAESVIRQRRAHQYDEAVEKRARAAAKFAAEMKSREGVVYGIDRS